MPNHEPDDDRRELSRPPWLSAQQTHHAKPPAGGELIGGHAAPERERDYGSGYVTQQDPLAGDVDADGAGRLADDHRAEEGGSAPERLAADAVSRDDGSHEQSARRMPLLPWQTHGSATPWDDDRMISIAGEQGAGRPVGGPDPGENREPPSGPQGSGSPSSGTPLPPPPPPWPPRAAPPVGWWPPPGAPGSMLHPGALPPPDWGDALQSPPERPFPAREAYPEQTFRLPPSLEDAKVVNPRADAPRSGWRRAVHRATGGRVNPGASRKDCAQEDLLSQIRQPLTDDFRIAVLSVKGGVGKTTTTLGLGSALAMVRRDRVIAVDANPDRGTLAERVHDTSTNSTVRDLLTDPNIRRYADVRGHTRMAVSRLEVLASEGDPAAAEVFDEADYRRTIGILGLFYNVILTDCGTGIMHSAMGGVLDLAHSIVLVSQPAMDAVRSASATLNWLTQHGHSSLVRQAQVVLSAARPGAAGLKLDKVCEFFEARCGSIHQIPFDPHLAEGADVDLRMLKPPTRQAYLELAGAVAQNFPRLQVGHT